MHTLKSEENVRKISKKTCLLKSLDCVRNKIWTLKFDEEQGVALLYELLCVVRLFSTKFHCLLSFSSNSLTVYALNLDGHKCFTHMAIRSTQTTFFYAFRRQQDNLFFFQTNSKILAEFGCFCLQSWQTGLEDRNVTRFLGLNSIEIIYLQFICLVIIIRNGMTCGPAEVIDRSTDNKVSVKLYLVWLIEFTSNFLHTHLITKSITIDMTK